VSEITLKLYQKMEEVQALQAKLSSSAPSPNYQPHAYANIPAYGDVALQQRQINPLLRMLMTNSEAPLKKPQPFYPTQL